MYENLFQDKHNLLENYYVTDGKSKVTFDMLSEDDKSILSKETVNMLYKSAKTKALKVNYMGIELSKGDITKFSKYSDLENAISILQRMYNLDPSTSPEEIPKLVRCLDVFKKYKNEFSKGFTDKNDLIITFYTNMVAALIASTALTIAGSIDYIKDSSGQSFRAVFQGKKHDNKDVYLNSIDRFLRMDTNGELRTLFSKKFSFNESAGLLNENFIVFGIGAIMGVVFIIRFLVFFWFYSRTKIADYLLMLSYFLEENAYQLEDSKTKDKQLKVVEKLKRLGTIISVDSKKAVTKTEQESKKEDNTNRRNQQNNNSTSSDDDDILLL